MLVRDGGDDDVKGLLQKSIRFSMSEYDVHMQACRLMVHFQGQVDDEIADKIDLDTTLKELAEISVKLGFHWEIKKI